MTQYARPNGTSEDGNWTNTHTASDNTNDPTGTGADGDFVTGDGTGGAEIQADFTLTDTITDPSTGSGHKLYIRFARGDAADRGASSGGSSSDCTMTVKLMEGGSARATRVITADTTPDLNADGSFDYNSAASGATSFNLTAGEANSIGTYNDLFVRVLWEDTEATDYLYVSQIVLETPDAGGGGSSIAPIAMNHYRRLRG